MLYLDVYFELESIHHLVGRKTKLLPYRFQSTHFLYTIENFSFNTSVSTFMIAANELSAQKCNSKEVLAPLLVLLSPYAPHISEELWSKLGNKESISEASFPKFVEKYLIENVKKYPISFNGKMRFTLELPLALSKDEIESVIMSHEKTIHYLEGKAPKKVIIIPGKIVNIVA